MLDPVAGAAPDPGVQTFRPHEPHLRPAREHAGERAGRSEIDAGDVTAGHPQNDAAVAGDVRRATGAGRGAERGLHAAIERPPASVETRYETPPDPTAHAEVPLKPTTPKRSSESP